MKRNVKLMVLLEFLVIVVAVALLAFTCEKTFFSFHYLLDWFSLAFILVVTIPGLIIMGEWKNFLKAFSVGQKQYSLLELKNINGAVSSCQKLILYSGTVGIISQIVILFRQLQEPRLVGGNLADALMMVLYMAMLEYLLIPVKFNAERTMNEEMDFDAEE